MFVRRLDICSKNCSPNQCNRLASEWVIAEGKMASETDAFDGWSGAV